jgi:hypothetical protein
VWLTSDGPAIVYDWLRDIWCTWAGLSAISGCAVGGELVWLDSSGYPWTEDTANYDDNGSFISLLIETGWLSLKQTPGGWTGLNNVGGYCILREIIAVGYFRDDCNLNIKLAYDNDPAWDDDIDFDLTSLEKFEHASYYGNGLSLETYQDQAMMLRIYPKRHKVSSFRVHISDSEKDGSGNTKGFSLVGLYALVTPKRGTHRVGIGREMTA